MQLNVTTDYAVRIVLYLASKNDIASSSEIAREMGIPQTYILKLTKVLKEAGILGEKCGAGGGFVLKKDPEQITLLTVVGLFEKTLYINRCLEEDQFCSRDAVAYCKVRELLSEIQTDLGRRLDVKITEFL